jgi:hypothetical protein
MDARAGLRCATTAAGRVGSVRTLTALVNIAMAASLTDAAMAFVGRSAQYGTGVRAVYDPPRLRHI